MYQVILLVNFHVCPKSGIETSDRKRLPARHPTMAHATAAGIAAVREGLAEGFQCVKVADDATIEAEQLGYRVQRAINYRRRKQQEAGHD